MSDEKSSTLNLESIVFTPDWARKSAGVNVGKIRPADGEGRDRKDSRAPGDRRGFGDRKPVGERKSFGDRKQFGDRKPPFAPRERLAPLDVDVKLLPETKALGTIIRRLQQDIHAYKLKDLAYFFLDNPSSVLLRITPRAGGDGDGRAPCQPVSFRQCRACGFAALSEGDVVEHILASHLGDYYEAREVDCEPPTGTFTCIARCGLSGELLGPPNIHEFSSAVREMMRTKYPDMTEEQYRSHIEMVRDPETIEAWRKGRTKKTLFFAKGADASAGGLTREQAEGEFKRTILSSLLDSPKHLMITADVALKSPVKPLQWAVRDALEAERRAPFNMCFALRGAFYHRKLKFFRANDARGPEFVTNVEYKEFDSEHAIPELAAAARFLEEHPCCDRSEFPQDGDFEKHMNWLVTTGHAVAFTNGVYSKVEKFPKYGPQWKKRTKGARAEEKPVATETPPAAESPAVEGPAVESPAAEAPAPVAAEKEEVKDEAAPVVAE